MRAAVDALFAEKEVQVGAETMRSLEKHVMLSVVDNAWKGHLASMDYLRQGIYLRGYAQKQPKQEFKRESFELFSEMLDRIKSEVVPMVNDGPKVGRNDPCPCGSGKKYKHCHGQLS